MKIEFILTCAIIAILLTTITSTTAYSETLEITNLSSVTCNFTYQQLTEMPQTTIYAEIYCYGSLVNVGNWGGIQVSYLLAQANATSEVNSIQFTASDGYTVTIPIEVAMMPETIIAYQKDGDPLPEGFRLILPGFNGASWIANIISMGMSNINVDPPAAAGRGLEKDDLLAEINEYKQAVPAPTPTNNLTQPTPKPTSENSALNPIAPPANLTDPVRIPQQQTANNQKRRSDAGTMTAVVTFFAIGLTIAVILTYKNRYKSKDNPPRNS